VCSSERVENRFPIFSFENCVGCSDRLCNRFSSINVENTAFIIALCHV